MKIELGIGTDPNDRSEQLAFSFQGGYSSQDSLADGKGGSSSFGSYLITPFVKLWNLIFHFFCCCIETEKGRHLRELEKLKAVFEKGGKDEAIVSWWKSAFQNLEPSLRERILEVDMEKRGVSRDEAVMFVQEMDNCQTPGGVLSGKVKIPEYIDLLINKLKS